MGKLRVWPAAKAALSFLILAISGRPAAAAPSPPVYPGTEPEIAHVTIDERGDLASSSPPPSEVVTARLLNELDGGPPQAQGVFSPYLTTDPSQPALFYRNHFGEHPDAGQFSSYLLSQNTTQAIQLEGKVDYADLNSISPAILAERIYEIFDIYFDPIDLSDESYATGRATFLEEMLGWLAQFAVNGIIAGIAGNAAYEALKRRLTRLHDDSPEEFKNGYKAAIRDLSALIPQLEATEASRVPIRTRHIAEATGMSKEISRSWLKTLGWCHLSNCSWQPAT